MRKLLPILLILFFIACSSGDSGTNSTEPETITYTIHNLTDCVIVAWDSARNQSSPYSFIKDGTGSYIIYVAPQSIVSFQIPAGIKDSSSDLWGVSVASYINYAWINNTTGLDDNHVHIAGWAELDCEEPPSQQCSGVQFDLTDLWIPDKPSG